MKAIFVLLAFLSAGCHSQSKVSESTRQTAKVTEGQPQPPPEVALVVSFAPRRAEELHSAVILNPEVQMCLQSLSAMISDPQFNVDVTGQLDALGKLKDLKIFPKIPCLAAALNGVELGRGRVGPFKFQFTRPGPGQKGFILPSSPIKKFE